MGVLESYPVVSISAPVRVKEDAGYIPLTVSSGSFVPTADLPLIVTGVTASDTGTPADYLGTTDLTSIPISYSPISGFKTIEVPITHDTNYRGYGEITFELADGDEYTASPIESSRIVKVIIAEAETSSRTIAFSAPDRVLEGEDIEVTFTNNEALSAGESIDVEFNIVADPVGFYDTDNSDSSPITFTNTTPGNEQTITIATNDSATLNSNGMIEIEVVRGEYYEPASATPHQVTIAAKETLPVVTIEPAGPTSIEEGEDAVFTVSASGVTLSETLPVSITVEQGAGEDFILDPTDSMKNTKRGKGISKWYG